MIRGTIWTTAALACTLAFTGCDDSPSDEGDLGIGSFEIRRSGLVLVEWSGSVEAGDTIRLGADDSVAVEFRWYDDAGEPIQLPNSADLEVTSTSPGVARWVPDPAQPSRGSFVTVAVLQAVTTSIRVELEVGGDEEVSTSQIPVKVSP